MHIFYPHFVPAGHRGLHQKDGGRSACTPGGFHALQRYVEHSCTVPFLCAGAACIKLSGINLIILLLHFFARNVPQLC
jgi:hypothetical protein